MKTIVFEGQQHSFPDDFTDQDITAALGSQKPAEGSFPWAQVLGETTIGKAVKGLYGAAKSAVTLPGDVYAGRVDPESPEGVGRAFDAATLGTPISPAIRAGSRIIPGVAPGRFERPPVPSATELQTAAREGYTAARGMGVEYNPQAVSTMATRIEQDLLEKGITPIDAKATFEKLKLFTPPVAERGGKVAATFSNLESARKSFQATAGNYKLEPADRLAASNVVRAIDNFLENPTAASVMAGPAGEVAAVIKPARANQAAAFRSNELTGELDRAITGVGERAASRAAVTYSGRNFDNALRQRIEQFLADPRSIRGWSDAELAAAERLYEGGAFKNIARGIGNAFGGGGGWGMMATGMGVGAGAGSMFGPLGALGGAIVAPATGLTARSLANRMSRAELRALDELVRKRSPLYQQMPNVPADATGRAAVLRGLLGAGAGYQQYPDQGGGYYYAP